jgi:hypothetical protein
VKTVKDEEQKLRKGMASAAEAVRGSKPSLRGLSPEALRGGLAATFGKHRAGFEAVPLSKRSYFVFGLFMGLPLQEGGI